MIVNKKYHFYAAHRNPEGGEKCGRIHGHTYEIECYFNFEYRDKESSVTVLFSDIDKLVEPIIKQHCHWFLLWEKDSLCELLDLANEPYLKLPFITSAENLSIWLFNRIKTETKLPISRIELAETKTSKVIYEIKS
jgi:6-pyruvoyl-tetrahydropterin synthase